MHCIGLARPGLAIGKNGGVVALERFLNEMVDLALIIDLILRALLIEDKIKVELPIHLSVLHLDLSPLP